MNLRKKIMLAFSCAFIFLAAIFCIGSILLTTPYINGFVGTIGIVRLELSGRDYLELGNDRTATNTGLVLVRQDRGFIDVQFVTNRFRDLYLDEHFEHPYYGYGIRNGVRYRVIRWTPFTRRYGLIRVEQVQ